MTIEFAFLLIVDNREYLLSGSEVRRLCVSSGPLTDCTKLRMAMSEVGELPVTNVYFTGDYLTK